MGIVQAADIAKQDPQTPKIKAHGTGTFTADQLSEIIDIGVQRALDRTGLIDPTIKSGRIYRRQMIRILGRRGFEEAVEKGQLMIHKHDPQKATSRVWARIEDWERFKKLHTKQKP